MVRCLTLLKEYVIETDEEYGEERGILPHGRYECSKNLYTL